MLKSLRKEPAKRYADAKSLAEDLDRFLTGKPILARRISRVEHGMYLGKTAPNVVEPCSPSSRPSGWSSWASVHYRYSTLVTLVPPRAGDREPRRPNVQPVTPPKTIIQADGSIRLGAAAAVIHGDSLVFEAPFGNLGYWHSTNDRAVWTFQVDQAATFTLSLDYACHDSIAGNTYEATIADALFRGVVAGTGSYSNYRVTTIGELELPAGTHRLEVRPAGQSAYLFIRPACGHLETSPLSRSNPPSRSLGRWPAVVAPKRQCAI